MSKAIYVCARNPSSAPSIENSVRSICNKLAPDNIAPYPPKIVQNDGVVYGITNPVDTILANDNAVLLGHVFEDSATWWEPLQRYPDGSYAMFRASRDHVELVSDVIGSRTIWYYKNDEIFAASTSQRAIIMLLQNFSFEKRIIPWVLSTGCLGPMYSWDKRLKRVLPDTSITLDRRSWSLNETTSSVEFNPLSGTDEEHEQLLRAEILSLFRSLRLNYSTWVLPLSGGYDSRGILCFLSDAGDIRELRTITRGWESSLLEKDNDAYLARELANHFEVKHKYYLTDVSAAESIDKLIDRFLMCGEGRVDHVAAYMDGFEVWKALFEDGVRGIIMGDEAFGWGPVSSPLDVRKITGIALCEDFSNLKEYEGYGFEKQEMPERYTQREGETLATWRDRLYQEYRIPLILAALADLKLLYVEQVNPLLSRRIVNRVRQLPDRLRTDKLLFKNIVSSISPRIGYAKKRATPSAKESLRRSDVLNLLRDELSSSYAKTMMPQELVDPILANLKYDEESLAKRRRPYKAVVRRFRTLGRRFLRNRTGGELELGIDYKVLAFRVYVVCRMNKILASGI